MIDLLKKTFYFSGLTKKELESLIQKHSPTTVDYKRGELVYPSSMPGHDVGILINGRCEIRRLRSDGSKTILNVLGCGDSFGILSVFSNDDFPTQVFATKNSSVLYFSKDQILDFVNNSSQFALNIINFLANRISFLNNKIATFSSNSVETKLASFILSEEKKYGTDIPFNVQKTSEEISAGRASIYRALEALSSQNLIQTSSKKIEIIDREGLERITK